MSSRSSSQQPRVIYNTSNAIGSSLESNPSRRICHQRAVPLIGHVSGVVPLVYDIGHITSIVSGRFGKVPKSGTALFRAISHHQPHSGKRYGTLLLKDVLSSDPSGSCNDFQFNRPERTSSF